VCNGKEEFDMSALQLAGALIIAMIIAALISAGVYSIRKGISTLPRAEELGQEPVWHKQPNILLGINNIVFALLVGLVASSSVIASVRLFLFILSALVFLVSVFLVIRTANVTMRAARNLRERQRREQGNRNPGRPQGSPLQ
jgi:hypothetical protein